jgi:probable HAF family extracellular repeat protein
MKTEDVGSASSAGIVMPPIDIGSRMQYVPTTQRRIALMVFARVLCFMSLSVAPLAALGTTTFTGLGTLGYSSMPGDVSDDGGAVVGVSRKFSTTAPLAFRWTPSSGIVEIGTLPGGSYSIGRGVSSDGTVVVGESDSSAGQQAFRWTSAGMVGLGDLPGGTFSSAAGEVSADGSVVTGASRSGSGVEAFRWTAQTGMESIGELPGGAYGSSASGISADGSVIVGTSFSGSGDEGFVWSEGAGMIGLGDLPGGGFRSNANAVSADGIVVVGVSLTDGANEAFRWTAGTGMMPLGGLPGWNDSTALDVSGDGSIVVGDAFEGLSSNDVVASIWTAQSGMVSLSLVLSQQYGVDLAGWKLLHATSISPDGRVIAGYGTNPAGREEAWVVTTDQPFAPQAIPEPGTGALVGAGLLALGLRRRTAA